MFKRTILLISIILCLSSSSYSAVVTSETKYSHDFQTLSDALTSIGSATATLIIDSRITSKVTVTIPANVAVEIKSSGSISSSAGLTINGPFSAGLYRVFYGFKAGNVVFGAGSVAAISPEWGASTDTAMVQFAVDTSKTSGWIPVAVNRKYALTSSVNIDRPVDTTTQEFRFIASGLDAGFYTSSAINMFSSTITDAGSPVSEFISFEGVRFEASANTVNCFVLNGQKFLRMAFNHCYFKNIRCAFTTTYFQTFRFMNQCNIRGVKGIFLETNGTGGGPLPGGVADFHTTDTIMEAGDGTQSVFLKQDPLNGHITGASIKGNLAENMSGPFIITAGFQGGSISGNYFEAITNSVLQLGTTLAVNITGNIFSTSTAPTYYAIDCQTSYNVTSGGNVAVGNMYDNSNMRFGPKGAFNIEGLISTGDFSVQGNIAKKIIANDLKITVMATGFVSNPSGIAFVSKNRNIVTLNISSDLRGTSNSTSMSLTGLPATLLPISGLDQIVPVRIIDNGVYAFGVASITSKGIVFGKDAAGNAFTNSGTKGFPSTAVTYRIY